MTGSDPMLGWIVAAILLAILTPAICLLVREARESRRKDVLIGLLQKRLELSGDRLLMALSAGPAQMATMIVPSQTDDPPRYLDDAQEAEIEREALRRARRED